MIKQFITGMMTAAVLSLSSCGSGEKDPAAYNNSIITVINSSEKHVTDMNAAMNGSDYTKAEQVRADWEKSLNNDIKKVEDLGDFKGDATFQKAVLDGLNGYKKIVTEDYPKLIELRKNKTPDAAKESALLDNINKAFENMSNGVNQASTAFESKYKS
ncbi:LIC11966 family surface protein [Sphingobacterium siyangense]|uniref:LIC11966 family surface protein n=1 Tax=Sphingobacterium siyangense TaxID=459529 RepID=UPI003DA43928